MWAKRRRNLALVRRRACSGSTFTKRARLTMTKRRSPISSSSCVRGAGGAGFVEFGEFFVELVEDFVGVVPIEAGRAAAREEICWASTRAGRARGMPSRRPLGLACLAAAFRRL